MGRHQSWMEWPKHCRWWQNLDGMGHGNKQGEHVVEMNALHQDKGPWGDGQRQVWRLEALKQWWWHQIWWEMVGNRWCNKCSMLQLEMSQNGCTSWVPGESVWAALWYNEWHTWTIHTTSQAPQMTLYLSEPPVSSRMTETWSRRCQLHRLTRSDGHHQQTGSLISKYSSSHRHSSSPALQVFQ